MLEASSLAGRRCLRSDDSLEVKAPAEIERRQEYEASHLEWMGGAFSQKNSSGKWELSWYRMTIEGVQSDLWAKVEGTEAIYSGEEKL